MDGLTDVEGDAGERHMKVGDVSGRSVWSIPYDESLWSVTILGEVHHPPNVPIHVWSTEVGSSITDLMTLTVEPDA